MADLEEKLKEKSSYWNTEQCASARIDINPSPFDMFLSLPSFPFSLSFSRIVNAITEGRKKPFVFSLSAQGINWKTTNDNYLRQGLRRFQHPERNVSRLTIFNARVHSNYWLLNHLIFHLLSSHVVMSERQRTDGRELKDSMQWWQLICW